jgi:hypothetical protein
MVKNAGIGREVQLAGMLNVQCVEKQFITKNMAGFHKSARKTKIFRRAGPDFPRGAGYFQRDAACFPRGKRLEIGSRMRQPFSPTPFCPRRLFSSPQP